MRKYYWFYDLKYMSLQEWLIVIAIFILLPFSIYSMKGFADPETARRVLTSAGYTEITTSEPRWFACGKGDIYNTTFTAKGPTGVTVTGSVCAGFFKNSTVRIE